MDIRIPADFPLWLIGYLGGVFTVLMILRTGGGLLGILAGFLAAWLSLKLFEVVFQTILALLLDQV